MPNLGGDSQRRLHLPEMWHPTLGRKGYQGGKSGTRKPSPPLRKRKKLATLRGGHGICSSDTGWARTQPRPQGLPTLNSAYGSVPITWGRTTYPQVPGYKPRTSPSLKIPPWQEAGAQVTPTKNTNFSPCRQKEPHTCPSIPQQLQPTDWPSSSPSTDWKTRPGPEVSTSQVTVPSATTA